jgi:hypothetical protein
MTSTRCSRSASRPPVRAPGVRAPFGPTLPELVVPRWRRARPGARRGLLAALVLLVLAAGALAILYPRDGWVVHRGPAASFNLRYPRSLHRVPAPPGAYARVEQRDAGGRLLRWFEVDPLRLRAFRGEITGILPVYAANYIAGLAARTPGFLLQTETKTRVNLNPGYTLTYSFRSGGRPMFARAVMLLPAITGARDGVLLTMGPVPSPLTDPVPDQVAANDVLQVPLRSFRFGT